MPKKRKRKATKQQLKNLAKGRAKRAANIRKRKRRKPKTRTITKTIYKRRPMAKRRRTTNLTGGSGDVNPQLYSAKAVTTVADQPYTQAFLTPISRLPKSGTRVAVMEILKVYCWLYSKAAIAAAGETAISVNMMFGTKDYGITEVFPMEPTMFASAEIREYGAFTALGNLLI